MGLGLLSSSQLGKAEFRKGTGNEWVQDIKPQAHLPTQWTTSSSKGSSSKTSTTFQKQHKHGELSVQTHKLTFKPQWEQAKLPFSLWTYSHTSMGASYHFASVLPAIFPIAACQVCMQSLPRWQMTKRLKYFGRKPLKEEDVSARLQRHF